MNLKNLFIYVILLGTICLCFNLRVFGMAEQSIGAGLSLAAMPNIESGIGYDFSTKTFPIMATTKIFLWKFIEFRAGGLADNNSNTALVGLSINAQKLKNAVGGGLEYAWEDYLDLSVGCFYGKDLKTAENRYGITATIIKYEFTK